MFKQKSFFTLKTVKIFSEFGYMSAAHALNNKKVQEFIHRNDLHFDLVINEEAFHDAFLMFAHKFKAPVVTIFKCNVYIYMIILLIFSENSPRSIWYIRVF